MPRIFKKDCKINLIEYGDSAKPAFSLMVFFKKLWNRAVIKLT